MRNHLRLRTAYRVALALGACFGLLPILSRADEPRVSFSLKAGWLHFDLTQEGKPIADALVTVYDAQGQKTAEGDSGTDGKGEFPLPSGPKSSIEFKIGKRLSDPVAVRSAAGGVYPPQVSLSFGLRPCCRSVAKTVPRPEQGAVGVASAPALDRWIWVVPATLFLGGALLVLLVPRGEGGGPSLRTPMLVLCVAGAASMGFFGLFRESQPNKGVPSRVAEADLAKGALLDLERRGFRPISESLRSLLDDKSFAPVPTQTYSFLGEQAPDFSLKDTDGKDWSLAENVRRGPVVLVFYYGYHCDHCVSQLFGLHKDVEKFKELGASIVAVSADPPETTRERYAKYGAFAFPVLSDPGNILAESYGTCYPSKDGEPDLLHGTFVIDREGKIVWANRGDAPFANNRTLLVELRRSETRVQGK